eukprot:s220_g5.t2
MHVPTRLRELQQQGYRIVIFSNQHGPGRQRTREAMQAEAPAMGDSTATVPSKGQAKVYSSLDAWRGPAPASQSAWGPHLVLDFGPSGSSEDDRAQTARAAAARAALPKPAKTLLREQEGIWQGERRQASRRIGIQGVSSGSSDDRPGRTRAASAPRQRQLPPNVQSETEEELTLEPETLKSSLAGSTRKKHAGSRSSGIGGCRISETPMASSKRTVVMSEAAGGDESSAEEKARAQRQAEVKAAVDAATASAAKELEMMKVALADAEEKASGAASMAASLILPINIGCQAGQAGKLRHLARRTAEAAIEARKTAEARMEKALHARKVAEAQAQSSADAQRAAEAAASAAAQAAGEARAREEAWAKEAESKAARASTARAEMATATAALTALTDANASMEEHWRELAQKVHKRQLMAFPPIARVIAEEKSSYAALGDKFQAIWTAQRRRFLADLTEFLAASSVRRRQIRTLVLAVDVSVRKAKVSALGDLRQATLGGLRSAEFGRNAQALRLARQRRLRLAFSSWCVAKARPRRLAAPLRCASQRPVLWALRRLHANALELRCEQRLAREVATQVQALQGQSQLAVASVRQQLEARVEAAQVEREKLLVSSALGMAREVKLISARADQQLLCSSWGTWQLKRRQAAAAMRVGRILLSHTKRQHLHSWQRAANLDIMSYLEVQIDCFDAFTAKRTALCWRVLRRCSEAWSESTEDLSLLGILGEWWRQVQASRLRVVRRTAACERLRNTGIQLLRRQFWHPWRTGQELGQRSLMSAMRQVEEAHAREELDQLKDALEQTRQQAADQRDTLASEFCALRSSQRALEDASKASAEGALS